MTPTAMHCYAPSPHADLSPLQRDVLQILRDARGFYRSSGMTVANLLATLRRQSDRAGESLPTRSEVHHAALALVACRRANQVSFGRWRLS